MAIWGMVIALVGGLTVWPSHRKHDYKAQINIQTNTTNTHTHHNIYIYVYNICNIYIYIYIYKCLQKSLCKSRNEVKPKKRVISSGQPQPAPSPETPCCAGLDLQVGGSIWVPEPSEKHHENPMGFWMKSHGFPHLLICSYKIPGESWNNYHIFGENEHL